MATPGSNCENFPCLDEIKAEMEAIEKAKVGDVNSPLGRSTAASKEVDDMFNVCITYHRNASALYTATSAFFSRDNVGLPGVALCFKVMAQGEINDSWMAIDFLCKRGATVHFGPTCSPPSDWMVTKDKDCCPVLTSFSKALAISKVAYKKLNENYLLAQKTGDAHGMCFLTQAIQSASEKVRIQSHYVTQLKLCEADKQGVLAIKQFDRRLPFDIEDYAMAAAVESTIPARLMIGTCCRAKMYQTKNFDSHKDPAESMRARAAFNQVA